MTYRTVGVIGAGVIGGAISAYLSSLADLHLSFILVKAGFDDINVPLSMRRYITSVLSQISAFNGILTVGREIPAPDVVERTDDSECDYRKAEAAVEG